MTAALSVVAILVATSFWAYAGAVMLNVKAAYTARASRKLRLRHRDFDDVQVRLKAGDFHGFLAPA